MATETYSLSADFPNGTVAPTKLDEQVRNSSISSPLDGVTSKPSQDLVEIIFSSPLSGGDQSTLDAIVAAHDGIKDPSLNERVVLVLASEPISVPGVLGDLGEATFDTAHSVWDPANALMVVEGSVAAVGGSVNLELLETTTSGDNVLGSLTGFSGGRFTLTSSVDPTQGVQRYRLRAQLNTAVSAEVDGATLTLFREITLAPN